MNRRIKRKPLASQAAELIEQEIANGVWREHLPGRRELAKILGVSAATCGEALKILDLKNVLEPAQQGRSRRIRIGDGKHFERESKRRLLILFDPVAKLSLDYDERLRELQSAWKDFGTNSNAVDGQREVIWKGIDFSFHKTPTRFLNTVLERHDPDAVIAFLAPKEWSEALNQRIPTFQLGGVWHEGDMATFCGYDLEDETCRAVEYLRKNGHERIMCVWDSLVFGEAARRGFRRAFEGGRFEAATNYFCPIFTDPSPEGWMHFWKDKLTELEPTAVILPNEIRLISFYGFCSRVKLRIPQELSVLMMNESSIFEWMYPRPTMMSFSDAKMVSFFNEWMEADCKGIGRRLISLELVDGQSVRTLVEE